VVVTALDAEKPVRGISLTVDRGRLSVQTADGKVVQMAASAVIAATSLPVPKPPPVAQRTFEVRLVDSSRVRGVLAGGPADHLKIRCPSLAGGREILSISIEEVMEIRRVAGAQVPGASRLVRVRDNDAAYRLDGSRITGTVESFGETGIRIDRGDLGARTVAYDDLAALFIDNDTGAAHKGLVAIARMNDGSAFLLREGFRIATGVVSGKTPVGLEIQAPSARLVSLGFMGGRFDHLSDKKPTRVERTPFFPLPEGAAKGVMLDFVCPVRVDTSPDGRPITIAHKRYFKGIGVRPTTSLTWKLDGTFKRFQAVCGIDDEVLGPAYGRSGGSGSVIFAVSVDGKEVWRSPVVKGGQAPALARVDLTGARELTLRVTVVSKDKMPKGRLDSTELDNAVWAQPLLIR
jgi:hypothetical protein